MSMWLIICGFFFSTFLAKFIDLGKECVERLDSGGYHKGIVFFFNNICFAVILCATKYKNNLTLGSIFTFFTVLNVFSLLHL